MKARFIPLGRASRERLGFPEWRKISAWLDSEISAVYPQPVTEELPELKNKEIPELACYDGFAEESFWEKFPKRELPVRIETKVNVVALRKRILTEKCRMARTEFIRAKKVLKNLQEGAEAFQKNPLPPLIAKNAKNTSTYGRHLTDTIATWVKKGFVAGPFDTPPMPGFRANPLGVVVRNGKVRPILNMSGPVGASFNDNVDETRLERLHMGTAKQFGKILRESGKGAKFSKFDIQDAYKLIPARTEDLRLQGYQWLGKYFIETRMSFGGKPSPTNFDSLAKTKDLLVCISSNTPKFRVKRALDDSPCVAPANSGIVERFSEDMKSICKELNIPLAANCPKAEKAFELVTRGTVLGIGFDSTDMTWYLSDEKAEKIVRRCLDGARAGLLDLHQVQKIMGSVNDLAQMCPLLKCHQRSGNEFLAKFGGDRKILKAPPEKMKKDLEVVAKVAESAKSGLPIMEILNRPGLAALIFYSDAAGASFTMVKGKRMLHNNEEKGAACIGGSCLEDIWGWSRLTWPGNLITELRDEKGCWFGSKSTTLESVGILMALIAFPDKIRGKQLVFKVDNSAVMWGWQSGYVKNDETATEILKSIRYLSGCMGTRVFIEHVDRMSNEMASLADELSRRERSKCGERQKALSKAEFREVKGFLLQWLEDPCGQSELCLELLKEMIV